MVIVKPAWKPNRKIAADRGATTRQFVARVGKDRLVIEVSPRGEGTLRINDVEIARITDASGSRQAFRELRRTAEQRLRRLAAERAKPPAAH